jgi:N-hydroxyarylamine O-acetyltransferase
MLFQQLNPHELQLYFNRIGCHPEQLACLDTLQQINVHHVRAIPFENLNAFLGLPVPLDKTNLLHKMVKSQRGGYCYEHNLLLGNVLTSLGFAVQGLAARVGWMLPAGTRMPRTHMLLLVTVAGQDYIADTGFGGLNMPTPLLLEERNTQHSTHAKFRIEQTGNNYSLFVLMKGDWQIVYSFTRSPQLKVDYELSNWYVATHPQSRFVNNLIAGRMYVDGRHTLLNQFYTHYNLHHDAEKKVLDSPTAIKAVLAEFFLLDVNGLPNLDTRLASFFS